jgi:hypothetical protein
MRERAEAATSGPWHLFTNRHEHDGQRWGVVETKRHPAGGAGTRLLNVAWEGERQRSDAAHIASWHPQVALAVAGLLVTVADGLECTWEGVPEESLPNPYRDALAVARAYLGAA